MESNQLPLRSYADPCGIARALDVIGERWALLIVRELLLGPKRFTDLKQGLSGASPNVLSQRLRELEASGVVRRLETGAGRYELTERGEQLHPILLALGAWGARNTPRSRGQLSVDALIVALETTFVEQQSRGLRARYDLRLDEQRFVVEIEAGKFAAARGSPARADATIVTDAATLRSCVFGDRSLDEAMAAGLVELRGDAKIARRFFKLFARPSASP